MKKHISIILVVAIVTLATGGKALAQNTAKDPVQRATKIKAKVAKLGTGTKAKATVKLNTGDKLKGYISSAGENDFAITDKKTGQTKTISYSDVTEVKKSGGLSTAAKIGIGLGIGVGVLAIVAVYISHHLFDNFNLSNNR
jgi:hypothetical protein